MSWDLITSIQRETDLRLILPFGLNLEPSDVISVAENGDFGLEGSSQTLLGLPAGEPRETGEAVDLFRQVGKEVSCEFRAEGEASSLFPELPQASAKVDVSFRHANSWVLALTGRRLSSLEELNRFRRPILDAYRSGVWRKKWALVTSVATADAITLLAAKSDDTKIALTLAGQVDATAGLEAKLTAGATIAAASKEITKCIMDRRAPVACTAVRVKDPWLGPPDVTDLARPAGGLSPDEASDQDFWGAIN
jgi:hypothetical protein